MDPHGESEWNPTFQANYTRYLAADFGVPLSSVHVDTVSLMDILTVRIFETPTVSIADIEARALSPGCVFASESAAQAHILNATGADVTVHIGDWGVDDDVAP